MTGIVRTIGDGRSGGKYVGSFVRLSMAITDAIASPRVGCTTSAAVSVDSSPRFVEIELYCIWLFGSTENGRVTLPIAPGELVGVMGGSGPRAPTAGGQTLAGEVR